MLRWSLGAGWGTSQGAELTDSKYDSPCHPDTKLYAHRLGMELICACGRAFTNPDCQTVVNSKRSTR